MKKALALALVASFALASTVSAFTGESLLTAPAAGKSNTYYTPITGSKDFNADSAAAQKAIEEIGKDAGNWGALLVKFCNDAQKLADVQKELANTQQLKALAKTIKVNPHSLDNTVADPFTGKAGADVKYYTEADEQFLLAAAGTTIDVKEPKTLFDTTGTKKVAVDEAVKKIKENQGAYEYVYTNYAKDSDANAKVATLQAEEVQLTATLKVIAEFADKNGLSLKDAKCAVPAGIIDVKTIKDEKKADEKKDVVPNTAAKTYFFAAKAPKAPVAKVAPLFAFDDFRSAELFAPAMADTVPNTGAAK